MNKHAVKKVFLTSYPLYAILKMQEITNCITLKESAFPFHKNLKIQKGELL